MKVAQNEKYARKFIFANWLADWAIVIYPVRNFEKFLTGFILYALCCIPFRAR
jgi:hypothetical protein